MSLLLLPPPAAGGAAPTTPRPGFIPILSFLFTLLWRPFR